MHKTNDSTEGNNSTITKEAKTTDPHKDIDKTLPTSISTALAGVLMGGIIIKCFY